MKRLYITAALLCIGILVGTGATANAASSSGYVNQTDINVMDSAYKKVNDLFEETNKETATVESVAVKAGTASTALRLVEMHNFSTELGDDYVTQAEKLKTTVKALRERIDAIETTLNSGDETAINAYFDALSLDAKAYDDQIGALNESVDEVNTATGNNYLWLTIAAGVISVAVFAWVFATKSPSDKELLKAKRAIAFASLAPLVGALITYLSFKFADATGGSYVIAWGPVIIGVVVLIRVVVNYFQLKKSHSQLPQAPSDPIV